MKDEAHKTVVFLTAGELPVMKTLQVSQVFENAKWAKKRGFDVCYAAFVPMLTYVKYVLKNKKSPLPEYLNLYKNEGIPAKIFFSPIVISGFLSFMLKKLFASLEAGRLLKYLSKAGKSGFVLHCRSYYAAAVAISAKRKAAGRLIIKNLFDMRSLLSLELAFSSSVCAKKRFEKAKKWETDLILDSDVSLMTTKGGINHLKQGAGSNARLDYIPISGFNRERSFEVDFERRWSDKRIAYVGKVGVWHDSRSIRAVFDCLQRSGLPAKRLLVSEERCSKLMEGFDFLSVDYEKMKDVYDSLLAVVIPGDLFEQKDEFKIMQMSINLFSTKAAEALSRGVPLVVSDRLHSLSDFVKTNGCGIILKREPNSNGLSLVDVEPSELNERAFWERLTTLAVEAGVEFTRDKVLERYEHYWRTL